MHQTTEAAAPKEEEEEEEEGPLWIKLKMPKSSSGRRELSQESPFRPDSPLEKGSVRQKDCHGDDDDADHDPQQEKEEEKEERICSVCKKGFSSGKALGGHVRVHAQPHTHGPILLQSKKMKKNNAPSSNNLILKSTKQHPQEHHHHHHLLYPQEGGGGGGGGGGRNDTKRHGCIVCGKNFKSEKSLFGHMRCHPERPWRGIHPPSHYYSSHHPHHHPAPDENPILHTNHNQLNNNKNSSSSTLSSDRHRPQIDLQMIDSAATTTTTGATAVDLSGALRGVGWSKTDRRGRKNQQLISPAPYDPCRSVSASSCWEFKEEEQDAAHELMCLSHHPHHRHHRQEEEAAVAEATANSLTNEEVVKMETDNYGSKRRPFIEDDDPDRDIQQQLEQIDDDDDGDDESKNNKIRESRNTKKRKRKRRRQVKIRDLGAVVIRDGGIGANIIIPPPTTIAADGDDEALLLPDRFKCSTCSKTFPTHQALGGHRSSHNKILLKHTASLSTIPQQHQPSAEEEEEGEKGESGPPLFVEQEDNNDGVKRKKKTTTEQNHHEDDRCETGEEDPQYNHWESAQHLCRICSKSFTTGQALGGHMRRHYYLPAETATIANTWAGTSLSPTGDHGKGVLNFDLNELPPAFEEEEGGGMAMAWEAGGRICE